MIDLMFDLDGCLIDSLEVQKKAFYGSYQEIVGDEKCPSFEDYIKHTGDSIDNVFKKLGLPEKMCSVYRRISVESIKETEINWDVIDLIKSFRRKGSKIAICTGKDRYRTEQILEYFKIRDLFDVLVCADDVSEPKPSPRPLLMAMKKMGSNKENVIYIGDGYNDILSARNAGVKSVLTLWYGDFKVPRESDFIVDSVEALERLLVQMTSITHDEKFYF